VRQRHVQAATNKAMWLSGIQPFRNLAAILGLHVTVHKLQFQPAHEHIHHSLFPNVRCPCGLPNFVGDSP
jgi:hypothetical protein